MSSVMSPFQKLFRISHDIVDMDWIKGNRLLPAEDQKPLDQARGFL